MDIIIIDNKKQLDEILEQNENVFINCGLTSCPPCKRIAPFYSKLNEKYKDIIFLKFYLIY